VVSFVRFARAKKEVEGVKKVRERSRSE
jgi:hypothetical protein